MRTNDSHRSGCPINLSLELFGDRPATEELSIRAQLLEEGGTAMWDRFMSELAHTYLGRPNRQKGPSVPQQLQAAYDAVCAQRTRRKV
jgi:predicted RNA polymerase sigma factor